MNRNQFSLLGLLWFGVACSAFFAQFAAFLEYCSSGLSKWVLVVAIVTTWMVIGTFLSTLSTHEAPRLLSMHGTGPFLALLAVLCRLPFRPAGITHAAVVDMVTGGFFFSSMLSFPIYIARAVGTLFTHGRDLRGWTTKAAQTAALGNASLKFRLAFWPMCSVVLFLIPEFLIWYCTYDGPPPWPLRAIAATVCTALALGVLWIIRSRGRRSGGPEK